jgi:nicotinate-nucleotide pyrophosphorylase (carboxylating)
VQELIERALAEDLGDGDLTSITVVPADARAIGRIAQKAPGVIAGIDVAGAVFAKVDPGLVWQAKTTEGRWREAGSVAEVSGSARSILAGERVALNFLGRLSGIATLTAKFVAAVDGTGATILDTRKTTPGLRTLEKRAVAAGGGDNHRAGLFDAILVKENHAALAGGVWEAARLAITEAPTGTDIVVECTGLDDVDEALDVGIPRILLDNAGPELVREAAARVDGRAVLEVSGGVTLANVRALAEAGADLISVGALTHSAPALDVSLTLEPLQGS